MKNKVGIALIIALCTASLAACRGETSANTAQESDATPASVSDVSEEAQVADINDEQEAQIPDGLLDIYVQDGKHADFVFHGTEGIASIDIYIDDVYSVFIWDSGSNYQAGIQRKEENSINLAESAAYEIIGDDIVIHADATSISDIDFEKISGILEMNYSTADDEYSFYDYKWDAVAQTGEYQPEVVVADADLNANGNTSNFDNTGNVANENSSISADDYWFVGTRFYSEEGDGCYDEFSSIGLDGKSSVMKYKVTYINSTYEKINGAGYGEYYWLEGTCSVEITSWIPDAGENVGLLAGRIIGIPENMYGIGGVFIDSSGRQIGIGIGN
ncbi:MAG: hypothetical protein K6G57_04690 [Lachnospiraceae bacterium]|nr:hypothetical protein [Lachnospiraceae bacterium]